MASMTLVGTEFSLRLINASGDVSKAEALLSIVMMIVLSDSFAFTSLMTSELRKGGFASWAKIEGLSVLRRRMAMTLVILPMRVLSSGWKIDTIRRNTGTSCHILSSAAAQTTGHSACASTIFQDAARASSL